MVDKSTIRIKVYEKPTVTYRYFKEQDVLLTSQDNRFNSDWDVEKDTINFD